MDKVKVSRFLSLVLRHQPQKIGLKLDEQGWTDVQELLERINSHGLALSREQLQEVVETNEKKRFAFSPDGTRIRASQGHSISVNLALDPQTPPDALYHGTATRFLDSILVSGLQPQRRQSVHLSQDVTTAINVGKRHGKPVVLVIDARKMHDNGQQFFLSENGVWLVDHVHPQFLAPMGNLETNKQNAIAFYRMAYLGEPRKAVNAFVGDRYIQHNPLVGDGPEAFIQYFEQMAADYPDKTIEFVRAISEGDLVALHTHQTWPGDGEYVTMDFFRFDETGKIVEHWDSIQAIPTTSKNGNSMY
jgi:putative RNA 2'-phosphotransferase